MPSFYESAGGTFPNSLSSPENSDDWVTNFSPRLHSGYSAADAAAALASAPSTATEVKRLSLLVPYAQYDGLKLTSTDEPAVKSTAQHSYYVECAGQFPSKAASWSDTRTWLNKLKEASNKNQTKEAITKLTYACQVCAGQNYRVQVLSIADIRE